MASTVVNEENVEKVKLVSKKAGMENVNLDKINEIISQASKGSNYYAHKQESQQHLMKRIEEMKVQLAQVSEQNMQTSLENMDKLVAKLEAGRDLSHIIVHIDMDAFYAAVETRDNPALADIPMAVGGSSMLSTSNYHARKFGVRAAMPGFLALKLCPELTIVPPNFKKYMEVSDEVRDVFSQYDPNFGSMSLDEAYLEITDLVDQKLMEDDSKMREEISESIVGEIRQKVFEKTQLTCSAGIAVNTRLAKVCTDMNKPNGQYCLPFKTDKIMEFLDTLPIGKVCGIGRVTEQQLNALDVKTCRDLYAQRANLGLLFSEISLNTFMEIALGLGSTCVFKTFKDMWQPELLKEKCKELCVHLSDDLKKENLVGKTVGLKIKTVKFNVKTRAKTLIQHTSSCDKITSVALWLLEQEMKAVAPKPLTLRLMGVRLSSLLGEHEVSSKQQMTLEDAIKNWEKISEGEPKTYTCPICAEVKSSRCEIAKHVDRCLEISDKKSSLGIEDCKLRENSTASSDGPCPVCNTRQECGDNEAFNRHIDECLSGRKVREMLRAEIPSNSGKESPNKRQLLSAKTVNKRRRTTPGTSSKFTKTIDMFFKT